MYLLKKLAGFCREASVWQIIRLVPYSLFASGASVSLVVFLQMLVQKRSEYSTILLEISGIALICSLVLLVALRWLQPIPRLTKTDSLNLKAWLLALQMGVLLLFIPAFLRVWQLSDPSVAWYIYPELVPKQWIFAIYWIALLTFLVFPNLTRRVMDSQPSPGQGGLRAQESSATSSMLYAVSRAAAKILLAAGLAWYLAGPPWNLDRHHRDIDFHEQLHLGLLQALHKGQLIDVGQAATAYGPGSQLVTYRVMELSGHFNIVGYREAGAFIHLVTMFVFCLAAFFLLGVPWGLVALALGLAYSPLHFFFWQQDGTLGGFHGWANGFRYLGTAVVLPCLALLARSQRVRRFPAWPAIAVGVMSGLFCWLSQENLSTTVMAGGVLLGLLWLTGTTSGEGVVKLIANVIVGFGAFLIPVLAYYAVHGAVGEFLRAYFLYPSKVFRGYSDNYWASGPDDPQLKVFHFLALFLIAVGVWALTEGSGFRLRRPLDARKSLFLAFLLALAASYPTSMFRSDSTHLMNTLIALPFVLVLTLRDIPESISARWQGRWATRVVLLVLMFSFFPLRWFLGDFVQQVVRGPLSRFETKKETVSTPPDNRAPFLRATRYLCDEPQLCNGNVPMRQFLEEASAARELIGSRRTYVASFPGTYVGIVYFMLDLNPAPYLLDEHMMIINSTLAAEAIEYFAKHVQECEAIISAEDATPETKLFWQAHPDATVTKRFLGNQPYYIFLAPAESADLRH